MNQLYVISSIQDPLIDIVKDDPVRPDIPLEFRCDHNRIILVLLDSNRKPQAVLCAALLDTIPNSQQQLITATSLDPQCCVFYTIWSYCRGAGRELIQQAQAWFKSQFDTVSDYVTLSPTTDQARDFHTRNGATVYRVNQDTVNYRYD